MAGHVDRDLDRLLREARAFVRSQRRGGVRFDDTEDIVQSSVREVLVDREQRGGGPLAATGWRQWLRVAVERKLIDRWRYHRRTRRRAAGAGLDPHQVPAPEASPSSAAGGREAVARLERAFAVALSTLDDDQRTAVEMARAGCSRAEIAARLSRPVANTRVLLARARQRLSAAMQRELGAAAEQP